jgi:RNA polymerase sigma-70 factor (ECF subfamily)
MDDESVEKRPSMISEKRYESFLKLMVEHEPRIRSFLRGLLPTWHDVEDVTQEASLVAWRKFGDFEEGTSFGGWLLTIARYEALKHRRRVARSPLVFADDVWNLLEEEANEENVQPIHRRHLDVCLEKLAPVKRDLLLKVHSPGVVMREVAMQTGKNVQAIYKIIQRLRKAVLDCVTNAISKESAS